ncbi:hypothetical protein ACH5RR_027390 [Cinchona calisaya]|uniref:DUF4408 domain-containing protein n=1 Tax=Cinchona calisaya TaxID=153742 RepID=A0ABD2Z6A7_9GENT
MDSHEPVFDNVKFEKAKAIARYNRFRKITKIFQFLEVFVALILISWSSTRLSGALRISGRFLFDVANYLFNPHVVFVIGNVIIVALFVLCRQNGGGSENSDDGDIYGDYVRHSEAHSQQQKVLAPDEEKNLAPDPPPTAEIKDGMAGSGDEAEEKQIVLCSKAEKCDEVTTAIETATKQIEKFQRTHSEKLKREIAVKPRSEIRRSETVKVGRGRTGRIKTTSFDTVDKLSNEEFNLTIDAVIKQHQEFLMEQKLAEKEQLKKDVWKNYRCASVR